MKNSIFILSIFLMMGLSCKNGKQIIKDNQVETNEDCKPFLEAFYKHFSQVDSVITNVMYQDSIYTTFDWVSGENIECLKGIPIDSIVEELGDNYHFSKTKGEYPTYRYKYKKDQELKHEYDLVLQKFSKEGIINEVVWSSGHGSKETVTYHGLVLISF